MATVDTTNGTYLANLFNPQVIADLIDEKLIDRIAFAPLAQIDRTLVGRAGDTVSLPYYSYIGAAEDVEEGHDIPIARLSQTTKQVTVEKIGKGVQLTDEAVMSGYGDPMGEAANQVVISIADRLEAKLIASANQTKSLVYAATGDLTPDDVPLALALFGEDNDGTKVLVCDADFYAQLLKTDWIPASEIAAEVKIRGVVGMAYGCQVLVSNRVKNNNFFIVKPGALAIFMKRDTMVETDRDIVNQSTVVVGSKLFAPYLLNESKIIRIVKAGVDPALAKITLAAAAGTASGDTAITVSGYTPGEGESYKYAVGDAAANVVLGKEFTGTAWNGTADITAASGKIVTIVSVDSNGKAVAAGSVASVPNA